MRPPDNRKEQDMTTIQITGEEITRPATTPITSSVLDHAKVVTLDEGSFGLRNDEGLWVSYNCLETLTPTPMCPEPLLGDTGDFKTFDFAGWQPGFTFAVQAGVQCKAVGLDHREQKAELFRVFEANEGRGVEQALLLNRFVASDSDQTTDQGKSVAWEAPTDLTPVGATVPLSVALAILEGYAATVYAGVPTIHMPRAAASLLGDRIVLRDGKAFTRLGSKVAIGGGYDEGIWEDGTHALYATGEVYVEKSERVNVQAWNLDKSYTGSDESGLHSNTVLSVAERMYRVAIDCFSAKITAKVW